jgi:DNA-directed RNA polymerase subunit M/transcription elongation factor TFIIS
VGCQNGDEQGRDSDAPQYCPKCGNLMTVRQSRGAGIARYVLACTKCRG